MATGHITKRTVDATHPASADVYLWDDELAGFGLKVTPAGSKVYLVQYRLGGRGGRVRRVTIGKHGSPWTPDKARTEAKILLGAIADGKDPAEERSNQKKEVAKAPSLAEFAERFLTEHAESKRKGSTATEYRRLFERVIIPELGKRRVAEIGRGDVLRLHHNLRTTPYQANRVLAVLSKMFQLAEVWCERPDGSNPCRNVEKYTEQKRERFLSPEELGRLGAALSENKDDASPYAIAAIRLLVFTGARLREILTLRWEWVNFERCEVRLPDSKTGAKTIHLPPPAMAILTTLPRIEGNPYVIAGQRVGACMVNLEKPWRRIRAAAGLDGLRLHDLRHAFASVAAASGLGLHIIGKMLGHSQPATTHRYAHLASDPVKAAAAAVAGQIAGAMTGERGAEVVPIDAARGKA